MSGYTKLFHSILASTIWREDDKTRIVWITMLAMADKNGCVEASIPGLADMARVTIAECEAALEKLSSPDKYSRTPDNEGRRIKTKSGGWYIINHPKYRAKMGADERREYLRIKQQEQRDKKKAASTPRQHPVDESTRSTHAEADTDAKALTPPPPKGGVQLEPPDVPLEKSKAKGTREELEAYAAEIGLPASDGSFMFDHWSANGWKNGREPSRDWKAGIRKWAAKEWLPSQKGGQQQRQPKHKAYNAEDATRGKTVDQVLKF